MQVNNIPTLASITRVYVLGRKLGEGSFGRVYISKDAARPPVAIKVFKTTKDAL